MTHSADAFERLVATNAALQQRIDELEACTAQRAPQIAPPPELSPHIGRLLDNLPGMVYRCRNDPSWSMDYVSAGAEGLTGYDPDDLRHQRLSYADLILEEDRARVWKHVQAALDIDRCFEFVYRIRTRQGAIKWVWERGWGIYSDAGEILMLEGFITDISALKTTEQALRDSEQRYRHIVESSHEGIWMVDADGHTTFVNSRMAAMLGYDVGEMLGRCLYDFVPEEWRKTTWDSFGQGPQDAAEQRDVCLLRKDGTQIWTLLSIKRLTDGNDRPSGLLAMAADITDRKRMEDALQNLAISDPLTGLLNRRHFYQLAEGELERVRRYRYPVAAIMVDLDQFKRINDTFGHLAGDAVLQTSAKVMQDQLRSSDILCRYGGEEFAVLLPETDPITAKSTAERLRRSLAAQAVETEQGSTIAMTASFGVAALSPESMLSLESLLDYADRMLYVAKKNGRNRVEVWDAAHSASPPAPSSVPPEALDDGGLAEPG
ncbi:sensor domain-containing diguanylate cyclase [Thiorhodococcus fuscus]|uniref:Diguanylate cyclase n=1 Tax=Thiorhodococcus fuscus TaxID=527200 RepID=A0ABW4Y8L1_9GAMM